MHNLGLGLCGNDTCQNIINDNNKIINDIYSGQPCQCKTAVINYSSLLKMIKLSFDGYQSKLSY